MAILRAATCFAFLTVGLIGCSQSDPDAKRAIQNQQAAQADPMPKAHADGQPNAKADPKRDADPYREQDDDVAGRKGDADPAPDKNDANHQARTPRVDGHGDALPAGAIARLGTPRWRHRANMIAYSPDGNYLAATGDVVAASDARQGTLWRRFGAKGNS